MFAAIDAGDTVRVKVIDNTETDPAFSQIEEKVNIAANQHHVLAIRSLAELNKTQRIIFLATLVVFAIGLFLAETRINSPSRPTRQPIPAAPVYATGGLANLRVVIPMRSTPNWWRWLLSLLHGKNPPFSISSEDKHR
jgi:hypothetical protein